MNNPIYKIERVDGDIDSKNSYLATINTTHQIFDGHFPSAPVVPGVCTIDMIKSCVKEILGREIHFGAIKECKFLAAIIPSQHDVLDVTINVKDGADITALVSHNGAKMVKLRATAI